LHQILPVAGIGKYRDYVNFETQNRKIVKEKRNLLFIAILLAFLVGVTYHGAANHQFVGWDDTEYVINNPLVTKPATGLREIFSTVISLNYHPVTILTMKMNNNDCPECLQGISAKPFIVWNIIFHLLNTLLVFYMLWLLSGKKITAPFLAAALFAVHPMHVESVAWVSERKDVLYTFFFLSGIITYIRYIEKPDKRKGWLIGTFMLFVLSCLSKAVAVVFPVVLLLVFFYSKGSEEAHDWKGALKNTLSKKTLLPLLPFFTISLFFGLMTTAVQQGNNFVGQLVFLTDHKDAVNIVGPFSVLQHLQIGATGFISYILRFFVPINLSPYHPYPMLKEFTSGPFAIELWLSVFAFAAIMVFVFLSLKKTKLIFFCLGFYFITIALVLQFLSVGTAMIAERYSYVPYIGLAFLPATLIAESGQQVRKTLLVISGVFILALLFLARKQVKVWTNTETLWSEVIKYNPRLELPHKGRGKYYFLLSSKVTGSKEKSRYEDLALADLEIAIANNTHDADVYDATGVILNNKGNPKKALEYIEMAISLDPANGGFYYNRAMVNDGMNNKDQAIMDYSTALGLSPGLKIKILSNRAVLYTETSRFVQAEADLNKLILSDPTNHMYFYNRAYVRVRRGNYNGAADDYKKVISLKPDNEDARRQLQILIDNGIK
jgi:protein O-mannosyl-transferase